MGTGRQFGIILGAILVLGISHFTFANGYYKSTIDEPVPPTIPVQRAMIVHRDGIETLVVESSYRSASPDVGWIVPVPAEPTKIEKVDETTLESLTASLQPKVVADAAASRNLSLQFLIATLVGALWILLRRRSIILLLILPFMCIFSSLLLPSLGVPGESSMSIRVSSAQRIGSYDVRVIHAMNVNRLAEWLAQNKLAPLNAAEQAVFTDYVSRGWCFVVAQLHRDGDGEASPHPLAITFPSPQPIFPMRATGLANSATQVDLIVVGNAAASADGFTIVVSDRFHSAMDDPSENKTGELAPWFEPSNRTLIIGHPDATRYLWDDCVVTRLSAALGPAQMNHDVSISLKSLEKPYRQQVSAPQVRTDLALMSLFSGAIITVAVGTILWRRRRSSIEQKVFFTLVILMLIVPIVVYFSIPVIAVTVRTREDFVASIDQRDMQIDAIGDAIKAGRINRFTTETDLRQVLESSPKVDPQTISKNAYTHQPIAHGRSPGNFAIRQIGGVTYFCLYDNFSRELRIALQTVTTRP